MACCSLLQQYRESNAVTCDDLDTRDNDDNTVGCNDIRGRIIFLVLTLLFSILLISVAINIFLVIQNAKYKEQLEESLNQVSLKINKN